MADGLDGTLAKYSAFLAFSAVNRGGNPLLLGQLEVDSLSLSECCG